VSDFTYAQNECISKPVGNSDETDGVNVSEHAARRDRIGISAG